MFWMLIGGFCFRQRLYKLDSFPAPLRLSEQSLYTLDNFPIDRVSTLNNNSITVTTQLLYQLDTDCLSSILLQQSFFCLYVKNQQTFISKTSKNQRSERMVYSNCNKISLDIGFITVWCLPHSMLRISRNLTELQQVNGLRIQGIQSLHYDLLINFRAQKLQFYRFYFENNTVLSYGSVSTQVSSASLLTSMIYLGNYWIAVGNKKGQCQYMKVNLLSTSVQVLIEERFNLHEIFIQLNSPTDIRLQQDPNYIKVYLNVLSQNGDSFRLSIQKEKLVDAVFLRTSDSRSSQMHVYGSNTLIRYQNQLYFYSNTAAQAFHFAKVPADEVQVNDIILIRQDRKVMAVRSLINKFLYGENGLKFGDDIYVFRRQTRILLSNSMISIEVQVLQTNYIWIWILAAVGGAACLIILLFICRREIKRRNNTVQIQSELIT